MPVPVGSGTPTYSASARVRFAHFLENHFGKGAIVVGAGLGAIALGAPLFFVNPLLGIAGGAVGAFMGAALTIAG